MITKIEKENILNAYKNASEEVKKTLEDLFGAEMFKPKKDVRERIKTFHDAYYKLGNDHPCVKSYENYVSTGDVEEKDIIAFLKLRIIVAALNEDWEPQFSEGENCWYPWFVIYSADELAGKPEEWKAAYTIVPLDNYRAGGGGLVCANPRGVSSYSNACTGARLALKTDELADYAARQFAELWADFYLIRAK